MRRIGIFILWRYWKFLIFCLFYATVTLWFLVTSYPEKITTPRDVTTDNQWKLSTKNSMNTPRRWTKEDDKSQNISNVPTADTLRDTEEGTKEVLHDNPLRSMLARDRDMNGKSVCDMDIYIQTKKEFCNDLLGNLTNISYRNSRKRSIQREFSLLTDNTFGTTTKHSTFTGSKCNIESIRHSCEEIRHSYLYGKNSLRDEERGFPLAFAMKVHTNANQAHRLLRYIYRTHNVYCIHVDGKASNELYDTFVSIANCLENVIVIKDRVIVIYSTIRQVQAEMRCMEAMMKSNVSWKYYINLTGQEFMLKTNLEIIRMLKLLNGTNNIESYPIGIDKDRVMTKTVLLKRRAVRTSITKEAFGRNITLKKGSAYGLFHRDFVHFITTDALTLEFIDWLNDTYSPEETIWATLNALPNVPGGFQGDITSEAGTFVARAVKWGTSGGEKCYGKFVRYVCVYGVGDLPWLLRHRHIVANKFYESFQPSTLDCMENVMYRALMSLNSVRPNNHTVF